MTSTFRFSLYIVVYQDIMVFKLNRSHCVTFFVGVYVNLCAITVIELIVFSHNEVIVQ